MWKILVVVAMVFSVTQTPVPATGKASDASRQNSQRQNGGINDGKNPPQGTPAVYPQNAGSRDDESKPQAGSSEYDHSAVDITNSTTVPESWPWHEKVAWLANLILAGIGIFGVVAAICTLKWIRHQSLSARIAAKASLQQANHLIASERAWIIVSSRFPDSLQPGDQNTVTRFRWEFKNVGKSPARLLKFDGVAQRADRVNTPFPDPPVFPGRAQPLNKLLLVPTDSWGVTWMIEGDALSAEEIASIKQWGATTLISYGYIKYLDIFGKEHTTRFCQEIWFDKKQNKVRFVPKIEAPASYTECD